MNLPLEEWEVYYSDNSICTSKDYKWTDIPTYNVLVVLVWHKYHLDNVRMKTIMCGVDYYYCVDNNNWGSTNIWDEIQHLNSDQIKLGVWSDEIHMNETFRKAFEKLDF